MYQFPIPKKGHSALVAAVAAMTIALTSGCTGSHAARGASEGAAMGAASCAVGSVVGSLVFGGNVLDNAARSAVYCGAAGAFAGGVQGSALDKKEQQARENELARLRQLLGNDAFESLSALAQCDYSRALSKAATARISSNPNYSLAGLWLEVLTYADQGNEQVARDMLPTIIDQDWDIDSASQAELKMREAVGELTAARKKYNLAQVCT